MEMGSGWGSMLGLMAGRRGRGRDGRRGEWLLVRLDSAHAVL